MIEELVELEVNGVQYKKVYMGKPVPLLLRIEWEEETANGTWIASVNIDGTIVLVRSVWGHIYWLETILTKDHLQDILEGEFYSVRPI